MVTNLPRESFVAGDDVQKAPGRLELVQAFLNSVDLTDPRRREYFASIEQANHWLLEMGLSPIVSDEERLRLVDFREMLREAVAVNAGDGDAKQAWAGLKPFATRACYTLCITEQDRPALHPEGTGADAAIAQIFAIVYDAIGTGTWPRLKACRKDSCREAFYDRSKNGSGAWCSMAVCGNRVKAQRRRARAKTD